MMTSEEDRKAYRCAVAPENASAELRIGRRRHLAVVLDTSRVGFTVRIENKVLKSLKDGGEYELLFAGEHWRVKKESHCAGENCINVGFSRVEDITKVETPGSWLPSLSITQRVNSDPTLLMYLLIAFIFACLALPGMGDSLGTAPRIQAGIGVIWQTIWDMVQ